MKKLVTFICIYTFSIVLYSQSTLVKISLNQQIEQSSQIIEGKVTAKQSFWDENQYNIYTLNTIEVYKVFKGITNLTEIQVITRGGVVGLNAEVVTPSLGLRINDIGVFMLKENTINIDNGSAILRFQPYASLQGFYKYDITKNIVINPFNSMKGISDNLYNKIRFQTKTDITVTNSGFNVKMLQQEMETNQRVFSIASFTPNTVTAGTAATITISGSGFGATQGTISFRDANYGGEIETPSGSGIYVPVYYDALASQIVSWSDTQIIVEVPSRAGTGDIQVTDSGGTNVFISSQSLTITHSETNVIYDTGGGDHAFNTWRCESDVYWEIGAVTTTDVIASDGVNVIRFDDGNELTTGLLGVCTSRFSGCIIGGDFNWYVTELDIVFEDNFTGALALLSWEFGTDSATGYELDFETVAVHELGHGHQLTHVINNGAVLHYSIVNGANNRVLGASDIVGANNVQSRSTSTSVCGQTVMSSFDCATLGVDDESLLVDIAIFPNPAKNVLYVKNTTQINIEHAEVFDVRGRLILKVDTSKNENLSAINISNLNSGLYFFRINTNNSSFTKKFVVE